MLAGRRIAVVMPAYNEAKLVRRALEAIPSLVDHIIVVDDASTDATSDTVRVFGGPVELIQHETNQGVGAAIATGCRQALLLGADLTAVMAADGQMDPVDLPALLAPLISGEADYVKGNRLDWPAASEVMPWHRWLGNHVFSLLTRQAIGLDVQDSQCGYAAMNRRTLQAFDWERLWKGYGYPNDLLSWVTVCGLRVREVPVRPVYGSEQSGIRLRHVMLIIPFVIARAWLRRHARRGELARQQPRQT
ncbi:MAG: glycosyltransferase family 2 protein [Myxococcales bacterium]|nr:glycosyltransferase family 2 protein [Myxococcales bacterium]MDH3845459.1 glycosyltransferase family 2 protein [Myxococcales bacterium]